MANGDKELQDMRKDLDELKKQLKNLSEDGGDLLASARGKLEAEADRLMANLKGAGATVTEKGEQLLSTTESKIEEHPWGTVLLTLGVGVAIGMLMRRR